MKKVLSLVLALSMVLGSFGFTFAAAPADLTVNAAGETLRDLGVLEGVDAQGNLALNDPLKRQDMVVLFSRLLGVEDEAKSYPLPTTFTDVRGEFYPPYIAWAQANGYVEGMGNNKFGFDDQLTGRQLVTFLLRALGHEDAWELSAEVAGDFLPAGTDMNAGVNRGVMAYATVVALHTEMADGEMTLGTSLGLEGFEIVEPAPEKLDVVSVSATNLKQMEVIFNQEVTKTSAETKGNYRINELALTAEDAVELQADGKTVIITFDKPLDNGTIYDIEISRVKSAAGAEMAKFEGKLTAIDNIIPEVLSIELIGPRHLEVTFSEPIKNMDSVALLVNNGAVGAINKGAKIGSNNTVLEIEIPTTLTDGNEYTVRVSGAQDYANFTMVPTNLTFTYVKDEIPPVATVKSASQEVVVIEFSKPVKNLTPARFYHTFASWHPIITDANGDAIDPTMYYSEVRLDFKATNRPLPEGTNSVVITPGPTNSKIQDLWGNELAETTINVTVAADRTAPVVVSVEAKAENKVEVVFSKDVTGADSEANFAVVDADGKDVTNFTAVYSNTNDVYKTTLTFQSNLKAGNYTLTIKDIKDVSLYENALGTVTYPFLITDLTPPLSITTTVVGKDLYVMFDEAVAVSGPNSALNKANYRLDGNALPQPVTLTMFDNRTVRMTGFTEVPSGKLTVRNIADIHGNTMGLFAELNDDLTPVTAPTITGTKTVDLNKIEITVDQRLRAVNANHIRITTGSETHPAAAASFENKANGTAVITVTLNAKNKLTSTADTNVIVDITNLGVVSLLGEPMEVADGVQGTVTDGIAPRVETIKFINANEIEVTFTEELDPQTLSAIGLNGFSVVGGRLDKAVMHDTDNTIVVLTGVNFTKNTNVIYNDVAGITDANGVKLKSFTHTKVLAE